MIKNIRNFAIIAHIDHGKSTLADRIIEFTHNIDQRYMKDQLLDNMDLEKERGITIKLNTIRLEYISQIDNQLYILNLIDTPGHVDFMYEVTRSLIACDGVVLLIDATQGIQAQTISHVYASQEQNLIIIPVINKVDLPNADPDKVIKELTSVLNIAEKDVIEVSAKTGHNVDLLIELIIDKIPSPTYVANAAAQALIFDSYYDKYLGVVLFCRVFQGTFKLKDKILLFNNHATYEIVKMGIKKINLIETAELKAGEVGWIAASIKDLKNVTIGDTITLLHNPCQKALASFKKLSPMVYCGIFMIDSDFNKLKQALEKVWLTDSSLVFEPENSNGLGFGFRCGFLGLLHMEIIKERLEREFNLTLITTAPSVTLIVHLKNKQQLKISNPHLLTTVGEVAFIEEPYIKAYIITPSQFYGDLVELCKNRRGVFVDVVFISAERKKIIFELPLNEIMFDFFDHLKSTSQGYASFDYEFLEYRQSDLVKGDILINDQLIDAFSFISHKSFVFNKLKKLCLKLKDVLPKENFKIPIQGVVNTKIIARETIPAMKKHVTGKCYGGDITRKKKLWSKQKEGKKRMKLLGKVNVTQEAFVSILKI